MRTFSLKEAQDMLPVLESLLRGSMKAKQEIEEIDSEFQKLSTQIFIDGGRFVDVPYWAHRRAQREKSLQRAKDALGEINAIGVQVKDLDTGLLDFPCKVGDDVILLCWKLGETAINFWHGMEEGFAGRKPIDERITGGESGPIH